LFQRRAAAAQRKPIKKRFWAVRQIAGPRPHGDVVIEAFDALEAGRQFFCYHGLAGKTYRYRIASVELPRDHPAAAEAIECPSPRAQGEMTLDKIQKEQFEDVEKMVKSGEAASAAP
jgi:hypothetical protein